MLIAEHMSTKRYDKIPITAMPHVFGASVVIQRNLDKLLVICSPSPLQIFNDVVQNIEEYYNEDEDIQFRLNVLPVHLFANGALYYFEHEEFDARDVDPVFAHFNFMIGDKVKIEAMKFRGAWRI